MVLTPVFGSLRIDYDHNLDKCRNGFLQGELTDGRKERRAGMRKLPESELEIMMIIWKYDRPVNRMEIEGELEKEIAAPTVLSFLNRLEAKGFVRVEKNGKVNWYTPLVREADYLQRESRQILRRMYRNSLKNFVTALYDGDGLTKEELKELREFLDEKYEQS